MDIGLFFGAPGYRVFVGSPVGQQVQHLAAQDARAAGIDWTFALMVDIVRDARRGRIAEGAGEDPVLGSAMTEAKVRGFYSKKYCPQDMCSRQLCNRPLRNCRGVQIVLS